MPAVFDIQDIAAGDDRGDVLRPLGNQAQGIKRVNNADTLAKLVQGERMVKDGLAQLSEDLVFQLEDFLLGGQIFLFEFFQLGSNITFPINLRM